MATIASNIYFLLLAYFLRGTVFTQNLPLGSSLFPTASPWPSPSGRFEFGFYKQGNGFKVGIWLIDGFNNKIVWTAYRDDPPVSSNAEIVLTRNGLLQTGPGQKKVIARSDNETVFSASMLDTGNFVMQNKGSQILWQSFDYPTDTMLGGQILHSGSQLVSSLSDTDQSSGRFLLSMQYDGNLVLYPRNSDELTAWDAYWASGTNFGESFKYYLLLSNTDSGPLCIVNASSSNSQLLWQEGNSSFKGDNTIYRATIDSNGVLQLYAYGDNQVSALWSSSSMSDNLCNVKGICGFNSYCTIVGNQPYCNCIPGTEFIDPSQTNIGCKRNFSEAECKGGKDNATFYIMSKMSSMLMGDPSYTEEDIPKEECPSSCLHDCYCGAAFYDNSSRRCNKQNKPLRYVRKDASTSSYTVFFKVGIQELKSNNDTPSMLKPIKIISKKAIEVIILIVSSFAILLCLSVAISSRFIYRTGALSYKMEDLGLSEGVTLRVFSYRELKKATNGFRQEVGKGSFGSVYKGTLLKGKKLIAVKRLHRFFEEGERDFQAEMQAIGKTHHKNLVRLVGYCAEGSKRLLVYEYMINGSLDKLIFGVRSVRPDWDQRRKIALDI